MICLFDVQLLPDPAALGSLKKNTFLANCPHGTLAHPKRVTYICARQREALISMLNDDSNNPRTNCLHSNEQLILQKKTKIWDPRKER